MVIPRRSFLKEMEEASELKETIKSKEKKMPVPFCTDPQPHVSSNRRKSPKPRDKFASFAVFRHEFTEVSKMVEGKWHDSTAFYVQGSAWKIGVKINAEDRVKFLGVYLRRCSSAEDLQHEHLAEVVMSLLCHGGHGQSFRREYQQKFSGEKKANYGWPQFKPWHEVILPKNGYVHNDSIALQVYLAASPPVLSLTEACSGSLNKKYKSDGAGPAECGAGAAPLTGAGAAGVEGSTLETRAQSILDCGLGSDCEIVVTKDGVNAHSFRASQILLARASPIFETMFYGERNGKDFIEITEADPDAFYCMLQFAYNCKWDFKSHEEAVEVYYLAQRFIIKELQTRAVEYVWPTNIDNVWSALHISTHFPERELKAAAMKVICDHTKAVFANPSFLKISRRSLTAILEQTNLQIDSELEVFIAAKNWAFQRCIKKGLPEEGRHLRNELGRALKYIRFLSLSAQEFIGQPMESGVLTPEETVILLRAINNKEKFLPCPHLCSLRSQRKKYEEIKK